MHTRKTKDPLWLRPTECGGVWYARTTVCVGGKSVRLRETSGFGEAERTRADIWIRRRIAEIENELLFGPAPTAPAPPLLPDFATAAADYIEAPGRRSPLGQQDLNKLLALGEFFGDTPVDQLDQTLWNSFVDEHLVEPADETVRRWFAMFRAPVRRALIASGLAFAAFDLPPPGDGRSIFLEEDVAAALHECYAPHAHPIVMMLRYQGCRIGEALRLRLPADLSFRRGTLTFRLTKNGEPRTVPMHDAVARELHARLGDRQVGPVFLTPAGEAYNDRRIAALTGRHDGGGIRTAHKSALARFAQRHGALDFHVHDWRHHWASWFIMKGGRGEELMPLGGWKDPRMIQRYVRLGVEHLRQAVNQV